MILKRPSVLTSVVGVVLLQIKFSPRLVMQETRKTKPARINRGIVTNRTRSGPCITKLFPKVNSSISAASRVTIVIGSRHPRNIRPN